MDGKKDGVDEAGESLLTPSPDDDPDGGATQLPPDGFVAAQLWLFCHKLRQLRIQHIGVVFAGFSLFASRMWLPVTWSSVYLPVLSPVYRQQEHWAAERSRVVAVTAHVGCGVVMLLAVVLQLDAPTRKAYPRLHRWTGRVYVAAGVGALLALRWLRSSSGAGSARQGDPLMAAFIDTATVTWLAVTAYGLDAIVRRRDETAHSRAMALSAALAAQPILQRLLNALLLAPCAMAARCIACLLRWGTPPWRARWGAPGGLLSLLLAAPTPPEARVGADARASPAVFSLDGCAASATVGRIGAGSGPGSGAALRPTHTPPPRPHHHPDPLHLRPPARYGESEQAAFGVSAVLALLLVLCTGAVAALSPARRARLLGRDDAALRAACCADVGRSLVGCACMQTSRAPPPCDYAPRACGGARHGPQAPRRTPASPRTGVPRATSSTRGAAHRGSGRARRAHWARVRPRGSLPRSCCPRLSACRSGRHSPPPACGSWASQPSALCCPSPSRRSWPRRYGRRHTSAPRPARPGLECGTPH